MNKIVILKLRDEYVDVFYEGPFGNTTRTLERSRFPFEVMEGEVYEGRLSMSMLSVNKKLDENYHKVEVKYLQPTKAVSYIQADSQEEAQKKYEKMLEEDVERFFKSSETNPLPELDIKVIDKDG